MTEPSKKIRNWLLGLVIIVLAGVFLVPIAIPRNGSRQTARANAIINNLRLLDAAKQQWALEHGFTNQLSEQDLSPYLSRGGYSAQISGLFKSVAGEKYLIKPLNESPEVILVRKVGMPWPRGSIMRFGTNGGRGVEIVFPDKTKVFY